MALRIGVFFFLFLLRAVRGLFILVGLVQLELAGNWEEQWGFIDSTSSIFGAFGTGKRGNKFNNYNNLVWCEELNVVGMRRCARGVFLGMRMEGLALDM